MEQSELVESPEAISRIVALLRNTNGLSEMQNADLARRIINVLAEPKVIDLTEPRELLLLVA